MANLQTVLASLPANSQILGVYLDRNARENLRTLCTQNHHQFGPASNLVVAEQILKNNAINRLQYDTVIIDIRLTLREEYDNFLQFIEFVKAEFNHAPVYVTYDNADEENVEIIEYHFRDENNFFVTRWDKTVITPPPTPPENALFSPPDIGSSSSQGEGGSSQSYTHFQGEGDDAIQPHIPLSLSPNVSTHSQREDGSRQTQFDEAEINSPAKKRKRSDSI